MRAAVQGAVESAQLLHGGVVRHVVRAQLAAAEPLAHVHTAAAQRRAGLQIGQHLREGRGGRKAPSKLKTCAFVCARTRARACVRACVCACVHRAPIVPSLGPRSAVVSLGQCGWPKPELCHMARRGVPRGEGWAQQPQPPVWTHRSGIGTLVIDVIDTSRWLRA